MLSLEASSGLPVKAVGGVLSLCSGISKSGEPVIKLALPLWLRVIFNLPEPVTLVDVAPGEEESG